jgi:hypothetical protein
MNPSTNQRVTHLDPRRSFSPAEVDEQLSRLNNEMESATDALARSRDVELDCMEAYQGARFHLLSGGDCPVPLNNRSVTNTHREEWVNAQIPKLWFAYKRAEAARFNARDYMEQIRTQISLLQSIGKSARQALDLGGGVRR